MSKFFTTILFLTLIIVGHTEKTYYQILGVKQTATEQEIKNQFKKLARKYHPDKIKDADEKEKAEKRFMEIANAYETIIDKQKREEYDMELKYGKGAGNFNQQNFNQRHSGQNYQDIFSSFFGGGGGGFSFGDMFGDMGGNVGGRRQQRQQDFGGQQQQQQQPSKPFEGTKVIEVKTDNIAQFYQRKNVWVILLYSQNSDPTKEIQIFKDVSGKGLEAFDLAAIKCDKKMAQVCMEEFNYDDSRPQIIGFPMTGGRNTQQSFKQSLNQRNLIEFAYSLIDNKVNIINKTEDFFQIVSQINTHKEKAVLIFSDKSKVSPLIKMVAEKYQKFFTFLQINKSNTQLIKQFQIKSYPTIMILEDITTFQIKQFQDPEIKKLTISQFLDSDIQKNSRSLLHKMTPEFIQLKSAYFCGADDKKICVLLQNPTTQELLEFKDLSQYYKDKPLRFIYTEDILKDEFLGSKLIIYKSKRGNRYIDCEIDQNFKESTEFCLDNVINGNSQFKSINQEFNQFFNL